MLKRIGIAVLALILSGWTHGATLPGPQPPSPPVITGPTGTVVTAIATVSGTGNAANIINVYVDGSPTPSCAIVVAAGRWSCDTAALTGTAGTPVSHSAVATATGPGGVSGASNTTTWSTQVPNAVGAPVISGPSGTITSGVATLTGTGVVAAVVTATVDSNVNLTCNATVNGSGNWTCNTPSLTNAVHHATAIQVSGGSASPTSATQTWTTSAGTVTGYTSTAYSCNQTVYIDTPGNGGNDANAGTSVSPIATLQKFNDTFAAPGVCGSVGAGSFLGFTANKAGNADTPTGYIVLQERTPGTAFITPKTANDFNTINLNGSHNHDYWIIDGFDITGPPQDAGGGGSGVEFEFGNYFKIMNSTVHGAASACIAAYVSDYVLIYHTKTYGCAFTNTSATSCIDTGGQIAHDSNPGFHIVVQRNVAVGCAEGPAVLSANQHTDGNCFITDSYAGYAQQTLVDDNVFIHCGTRGLHILASSNVTVINNTVLYGHTDLRWENANDGELTNIGNTNSVNSNNVFCNNIAVENGDYSPSNFAIADFAFNTTNPASIYKNNLTFNGTPGNASTNFPTGGSNKTLSTITVGNGNILGSNPLLTAPSTNLAQADFHVQAGSPALNAGTTSCGYAGLDFYGNARVVGGSIDIGATQGAVAPSWGQVNAHDDLLFPSQLFSGGGLVGQSLLTNTNTTGGTDLFYNSPVGYPFMIYAANKIRLAYAATTPGPGLINEPQSVTNYLLNSAAPATQTTGTLPTGSYTLWGNMQPVGGFATAGSLTISAGTATGCTSGSPSNVATQGAPITFTITVTGTCVVTVAGSVYFEQLENGTVGTGGAPGTGTSGIVTAGATVTRSSDFYKIAGTALTTVKATPGSVYFAGSGSGLSGANLPYLLSNDAVFSMMRGASTTTITNTDSTTTHLLTATLGAGTTAGPTHAGLAWSSGGRSLVANAGTVATDAFLEPTTSTLIALGDSSGSGNSYAGFIGEFADWNTRLADATLQAITTGAVPPPPIPSPPVMTGPSGTVTSATGAASVSGTGSGSDTIAVYVDGSGSSSCTTSVSAGNFACTVTVAAGAHTAKATETNVTGTSGLSATPASWTEVISTPPAPPVISSVNGGGSGSTTSTGAATFVGTGVTGAVIALKIDGVTNAGCTPTVSAGAWTCTTAPVASGAHSATATQTNAGGTSAASSPAFAWTYTPSAPASFDFTLNFNSVALGTVINSQTAVNNIPTSDGFTVGTHPAVTGTGYTAPSGGTPDASANIHTVVAGVGGHSNRLLQLFHPAGQYGSYTHSEFDIYLANVSDTFNMEFDVYFAPGFDFHATSQSAGKLGPGITIGDGTTNGTAGDKNWWQCNASAQCTIITIFEPYAGNPANPPAPQLAFPNTASSNMTGVWRHFKFTLHRGSDANSTGAYAQIFYNRSSTPVYWWGAGGPLSNAGCSSPRSLGQVCMPASNTTFLFKMLGFFGGGTGYTALSDSYQLIDSIRIWSGTGP